MLLELHLNVFCSCHVEPTNFLEQRTSQLCLEPANAVVWNLVGPLEGMRAIAFCCLLRGTDSIESLTAKHLITTCVVAGLMGISQSVVK